MAILSAFKENPTPRTLGGSWEGKVKITEDFDDDLIDGFYNSAIFPGENELI